MTCLINDILSKIIILLFSLVLKLQKFLRPQKDSRCLSWAVKNRRKGNCCLILKEENFFCSFEKEENSYQILEPFYLLSRIDSGQIMLLYCPGRVYDTFRYPRFQDALFWEAENKFNITVQTFNEVMQCETWPSLNNIVFLWSSATKSADAVAAMLSKFPESVVLSHPQDFMQIFALQSTLDSLTYEKLLQNILKFQMIQILKRYPETSTSIIVSHHSNFWYVEKIASQIQNMTRHFFFDDDRNVSKIAPEIGLFGSNAMQGLQQVLQSKVTLKEESNTLSKAVSNNLGNLKAMAYLQKVMVLLLFREYSHSSHLQNKLFAITSQDLKSPISAVEFVVSKMQSQTQLQNLTDYAKREINEIAQKFVNDLKEIESGQSESIVDSSQVWEQFDEMRAQLSQLIPL